MGTNTGELCELLLSLRSQIVGSAERRCPGSGEDIYQDTFLACWERYAPIGQLQTKPLVLRIAKNKNVDDFRRRRRTMKMPEDISELSASSLPADLDREKQQRDVILANAVEKLPQPYCALVKAYLQRLRLVEIARRDGVRPSTIRSQLHRAIGMLKRIVCASTSNPDWAGQSMVSPTPRYASQSARYDSCHQVPGGCHLYKTD
jgi:RNA polymerase sigma factor (sigma-70 family)